MVDYKKQGAANRKKGSLFERKARRDLEEQGWTVSKWQNNIDLDKNCMHAARQKFIRGRGMGLGSGFPDFVAFMQKNSSRNAHPNHMVVFIECKTNGYLSKIEKQKMQWLEDEGFTCWIAYDEDGKVGYKKFVDYARPRNVCRKEARDRIR